MYSVLNENEHETQLRRTVEREMFERKIFLKLYYNHRIISDVLLNITRQIINTGLYV